MRGIWGGWLVLAVGCAPAAPRPGQSAAPLPPTRSAPTGVVVPHPARWSGLPAFTSDHHPLALGSDLLYLGAAGRRLVLRSDGFAEATQLAPEPLVAVRAAGSGFRFFGAFGAIYESEAPLSTFSTVQAGVFSFTTRPEVAVGQRNALAIGDGRVYLSKDGARFQQVDKQAFGIPAWARPRHVAMNAKGEGALVAAPQRLFLTKDDGKTWQAADPPAGGLAGLGAGAHEDLFATSIVRPFATMRLDGTLYTASRAHVEIGASPAYRRAVFVDERLVVFDEGRLEVVHADGVRIVTKLTASRIDAVGGSGPHLVAIGPEQIRVSHDGGGHFDESLSWDVKAIHERPRIRVEGSAFVVANCDTSCSTVSARASGGALHDVTTEEGATVLDVALSRGTLYLLGHFDGKVRLYAGPPSATKLARFGTLDHAALAPHGIALTADEAGVRALVSGWWRETIFLSVDAAGAPREPVRIPYAFVAAALTGTRGLARVSADPTGHLVETMDGGEHWTPVGGPDAAGQVDCTAYGCTLGGIARFGWDLPAPTDGPREEPVTTVGKQSTLTCARKGSLRKVSEAPVRPLVDGSGLRLVVIEADDAQGQTLEVLGQKPIALAPKAKLSPKKAVLGFAVHDGDAQGRVVVTKADVVPGGVLATRAHVPSSVHKPESLGPVGLEVFWWSRASNKVRAAELGTLPPFRVAMSSSALDVEAVVLADDSLLLHPDSTNTAWLVAPDGKARMLSFPQSVRLRGAARAGSLLRFAGSTAAGEAVGVFDTQGLTYTVGWNLGEASATLATIGGVPYLATPEALFSLEDLSSSVPDPVLRGAVAPTCPAALGPVVEEPADRSMLLLDGEDTPKLRAHLASVSVDAKGHGCLVARSFHATRWKDHSQAWVGGGGGWLLRDGNLQALACNP